MRTVLLITMAFPALLAAQQQQQPQNRWVDAKCDVKPNNRDVNQGMLYLKSATTGRDAEQKKKDLADAQRMLTTAVTGGQDKNPAAWYYLGRYYLMVDDAQGADSAFTRAQTLQPGCEGDILLWRRSVWQPTFNAGIAAWQANNLDSAIAAFRRATFLFPAEPTAYKYVASLYYNTGHQDSAVVYFRKTANVAAADPKFAQDRRDALFNMGRVQQSMQKVPEAMATYREYLAAFPNDPEVMAALGGAYMLQNQRDSAFAIYREVVQRGDSIGYYELYKVGAEISSSVPEEPDTAKESASCRTSARSVRPALTVARIRARCDSVSRDLTRNFKKSSDEAFSLAAQALDASLRLNPYNREALIFRANTALGMRDSATALAMSRRLIQVDPMSRVGLKIMASSQAQNHNVDSALYYFKMSDSLLIGDVAITQFDSTEAGRDVKGIVTNPREAANAPFKLVFQFVDLQGNVVATDTVAINAIQPGQSQQFELHPKGPSIAAWRYKKE